MRRAAFNPWCVCVCECECECECECGIAVTVCVDLCCDDQVFIKQLWEWLTHATVGIATFAISIAIFTCVCMGCFCQHVECHGCKPKLKKVHMLT